MSRTNRSRTQTTNQEKTYAAFFNTAAVNNDAATNPDNLFDQSNQVDNEWAIVAKAYLQHKRQS